MSRPFTKLIIISRIVGLGILLVAPVKGVTPPEMVILDRNDINMASGTPSFKVNDLKIGSDGLSLSHSIASYAGYLFGYHDEFSMGIYESSITRGVNQADRIPVMTVTLGQSTKNFLIEVDGTFTDLRNDGETLIQNADGSYLYTKKDGTKVFYKTAASVNTITRPDGFKTSIHYSGNRISSVTTNTGLQFKWIYSSNTKPTRQIADNMCIPYLPSSCQDVTNAQDAYDLQYAREAWSFSFPTQIVAINNGAEYCDPIADTCTLIGSWPQSSYEWDAEMPDAIYEKETDFTVTDMAGKITVYRHIPFDTSLDGNGEHFIPRVKEIRDGHTDAIIASYSYENKPACTSYSNFYISCTAGAPGVLTKVVKSGQEWGYSIGEDGEYRVSNAGISGPGRVTVQNYKGQGVPVEVNANGTFFKLQFSDSNRIYETLTGVYKSDYGYDFRGNLIRRTDYGAAGTDQADNTILMEAGFPETCDNMKTCNQPLWEKDGKGNQTDYVYHAESGKLARVTAPADDNGIRPQTRYKYEQFYARYRKDSNVIVAADTPIWLLTEQSSCIAGNAKAPATGEITVAQEGCAAGEADEVKITYEYGPATGANNLFMTGKATTADGKTLRTCYEYDQYGNQIGETKPLGTSASCN